MKKNVHTEYLLSHEELNEILDALADCLNVIECTYGHLDDRAMEKYSVEERRIAGGEVYRKYIEML